MKVYKTKVKKFSGSDFREVHKQAVELYHGIKRKSKRRSYVRSNYFDKDKIFLDLFWQHLFDKDNWRDRVRRLKYFGCGIELIQKTTFAPQIKENPNKNQEQKFLISIFPKDGPI